MFTWSYGVRENGAWQEWLLARPEHLALVPDAIGDVGAASLPVAYLTAQTRRFAPICESSVSNTSRTCKA
jgi:NADPH:quinone reductase-like Zn-dependent oxidoreductase